MKKNIINIYNENTEFQYFDTLKKNRNKRHSCGEFFVEGVRNINECIKNGWQISAAIYSDELSDWAKSVLRSPALKDAGFYSIEKDLMKKLSDKEDESETSELILIVKIKDEELNSFSLHENSTVLIFDRPSNKGNLGTIIRTCDSFGADALIITGHAVDLYDSETLRASMGSFFKQKVIREPSFENIAGWIRRQKDLFSGLKVTGTSARTEEFINTADLKKFADSPNILVIGNETAGMSRNFFELCDTLLKIPMYAGSSASSLNVACAAAIILYEFTKDKNIGNGLL